MNKPFTSPLAERMRPSDLKGFLGQQDILGPGKALHKAIIDDNIHSMLFWGPPGSGKTTLARIIANTTGARFVSLSAVMSGVKELREVMAEAVKHRQMGTKTILFIDEIHRFSKSQQDAFLPYVESGDVVLIGATTENPSFRINSALLSRCRVYTLKALPDEDLSLLLHKALTLEEGLGQEQLNLSEEGEKFIIAQSNGDGRTALNLLEVAASLLSENENELSLSLVMEAAQSRAFLYDKDGEEHYNLISAFHKSLRNSDPDAALYWLVRMIEGGEDPFYITRRMIRFASEDIGMAEPSALSLMIAVNEAVRTLGLPEADVHLVHGAIYLATAPKSNSAYSAICMARKEVQNKRNEPVPLHLRNAPTKLMKELDYGKGYQYAHSLKEGIAAMDCLPENMKGKKFYFPKQKGFEKIISERLIKWEKFKKGRE